MPLGRLLVLSAGVAAVGADPATVGISADVIASGSALPSPPIFRNDLRLMNEGRAGSSECSFELMPSKIRREVRAEARNVGQGRV